MALTNMTTRKKCTRNFQNEAVELFSPECPGGCVGRGEGWASGPLGNWLKKNREEHPEKFDTGEQVP